MPTGPIQDIRWMMGNKTIELRLFSSDVKFDSINEHKKPTLTSVDVTDLRVSILARFDTERRLTRIDSSNNVQSKKLVESSLHNAIGDALMSVEADYSDWKIQHKGHQFFQ